MKIARKQIKIRDLAENYKDDGEGGVYAYNDRLVVRSTFQREFCYAPSQRDVVIDTVMKNRPLTVMYWSKIEHISELADYIIEDTIVDVKVKIISTKKS